MISPGLCKLSLLMLLMAMVDSNSVSELNQFFALFFNICLHRDQPNVDFKMVDSHVHQWKGSSSRYIKLQIRFSLDQNVNTKQKSVFWLLNGQVFFLISLNYY